MTITVYLDETGTNAGSSRIMVGAIVSLDDAAMSHVIEARAREVASDASLWPDVLKRPEFVARGFHHNEDSDTVRDRMIETMRSLDFRAHVCFSRRGLPDVGDVDLLILMYYAMLRNLIRRYAGVKLEVVFETNSQMDPLYGQITEHALQDVKHFRAPVADVTARIGQKPSAGLSVVDYMLALSTLRLDEEDGLVIKPFQSGRILRVRAHVAHVIDFDRNAHRRKLARIL